MIDEGLPGAHLIAEGLAGLRSGTETDESLLVSLAATRLRQLDIDVPEILPDPVTPEQRLYVRLVARLGRSAGYQRYNSLLERLVSFEDALSVSRRSAQRRESH